MAEQPATHCIHQVYAAADLRRHPVEGAIERVGRVDRVGQRAALNFDERVEIGWPIPAGLDVSLKIDGSLRGSGYTGCNSWSATLYPVANQHLLVGPYALTKKQCGKDIQAVELGFLSALTGSPTWDLVNGDLVIKGPKGALRLARSL